MEKNSLDVLCAKFDDLKDYLDEKFACNDEYHKLSNGRIKKLELWKAGIVGGFTIVTLFSGFMINGFYQAKNELEEKLNQIHEIEKRITLVENYFEK
jgi:hypothetical protein